MENITNIAQLVVALSVAFVWIFRFENIVKEFKQYGLSSLTRTMVGAAKLVLATLLVVGIWYSELVLIPAILMGVLMVAAQYFHFKAGNPWKKRLPSLVLLLLSAYIALAAANLL
ncbi:DoxX family protein [Gillisia sp. Q332]|uniref:DoxX family protein n=1 Tax=Gillisia xinjiangensis TaxID=3384765 RepID=UPI0039191A6E